VFIYEQPKTGDIFTIVDPNLHLDQLEQVQHDVAQLLEHGLNPPSPPAAAEVSATVTEEISIAETEAAPPPVEPAPTN
jgi:hypothetical protein